MNYSLSFGSLILKVLAASFLCLITGQTVWAESRDVLDVTLTGESEDGARASISFSIYNSEDVKSDGAERREGDLQNAFSVSVTADEKLEKIWSLSSSDTQPRAEAFIVNDRDRIDYFEYTISYYFRRPGRTRDGFNFLDNTVLRIPGLTPDTIQSDSDLFDIFKSLSKIEEYSSRAILVLMNVELRLVDIEVSGNVEDYFSDEEKELVIAYLNSVVGAIDYPKSKSEEPYIYTDAGVIPKNLNWEMVVAMYSQPRQPSAFPTGEARKKLNHAYFQRFEENSKYHSKVRPLDWGNIEPVPCTRAQQLRVEYLFQKEVEGVSECGLFDVAKRYISDLDGLAWLAQLPGYNVNGADADQIYDHVLYLFPHQITAQDFDILREIGYDFDRSYAASNDYLGWALDYFSDSNALSFSEYMVSKMCFDKNKGCEEVCKLVAESTSVTGNFVIPFFEANPGELKSFANAINVGPACTRVLRSQLELHGEALTSLKSLALRKGHPYALAYLDNL